MHYAVLIADVISSRSYSREKRQALQELISSALASLNFQMRGRVVEAAVFSGGDEVQGLYVDADAAVEAYGLLCATVRNGSLRAGIGVGEWSVRMSGMGSAAQDGSAFHLARAALGEAKLTGKPLVIKEPPASLAHVPTAPMDDRLVLESPDRSDLQHRMPEGEGRPRLSRYDYEVRLRRNSLLSICRSKVFCRRVRSILLPVGEAVCEEYGSSSLPWMISKPTIDLMVSSRTLRPSDIVNVLSSSWDGLDEVDLGSGMPDRRMLRLLGGNGYPLLNVHVVAWGFWCSSRERRFCALLHADRDLAIAYSHVKRFIVSALGNDPALYGVEKDKFVRFAQEVGDLRRSVDD